LIRNRIPVPAVFLSNTTKKLILFLIKNRVMNMYGGVEVQLHIFSISALHGGECQLHVPAYIPQGNSIRYPLDRRLSGLLHSPAGCYEKNNPLCLQGIKPRFLIRAFQNSVAVTSQYILDIILSKD
jgi:hypothetical protein